MTGHVLSETAARSLLAAVDYRSGKIFFFFPSPPVVFKPRARAAASCYHRRSTPSVDEIFNSID
jgi:hypothetical protein